MSLIRDRLDRALRERGPGLRTVGSSIPRELPDAYGLAASLMLPPGTVESESRGEVLSGPGFCSWCKSALGSSESDSLWIGGATCDQMRRCLELAGRKSGSPPAVIHVPKTRTAEAEAFYLGELGWLAADLEKRAGRRPSDRELRFVIETHNEKRRLMREARPKLRGGDFLSLVLLDGLLAAADMIDLLKRGIPASFPSEGVPVMLAGSPSAPADIRWLDILESLGLTVVADATSTGDRSIDFDVAAGGDPLMDLARAYAGKPPCAWARPNDAFYDYAASLVRRRGARAVLWRSWRGCDIWSLEAPRAVRKLGLPLLALDMTFGDIDSARIRTRVEAFAEELR